MPVSLSKLYSADLPTSWQVDWQETTRDRGWQSPRQASANATARLTSAISLETFACTVARVEGGHDD
jgi:type IV secretory pathway TrbF-like protein